MTIEERLKDLILKRYNSIREFTIEIDMPYTTMDSIFRRGIGNSSVSNVIKICKALGISADALADGEIAYVQKQTSRCVNDWIEVKELLSDTKDLLTHSEVKLDGKPMTKKSIDSLVDAIDIGVEMAKKKV